MSLQKRAPPRLYTHEGITLTAVGWAKKLGVSKGMLKSRLQPRSGWTVAEALSRPQMQKGAYARRQKLIVISAEQIFRAWARLPPPDTSSAEQT